MVGGLLFGGLMSNVNVYGGQADKYSMSMRATMTQDGRPTGMPMGSTRRLMAERTPSELLSIGVSYVGQQDHPEGFSFPLYTDSVTGTTFSPAPGETLERAVLRKRREFKAYAAEN